MPNYAWGRLTDARTPVNMADRIMVTITLRSAIAPGAARNATYIIHLALTCPPPFSPSDDLRARARAALSHLDASHISQDGARGRRSPPSSTPTAPPPQPP